MKSEKFWENLKIHAGGDDKQRIQFAPPNMAGWIESLISVPMAYIIMDHVYSYKINKASWSFKLNLQLLYLI